MTQPGQTLHYWLAHLMREAREDAGVKPSEIAGLLSVDQSTVMRFEDGITWPKQIDQYLAAYAKLLEVADARDFYAEALRRWHKGGEPPELAELTAAHRMAAAQRRAARRTKQSRRGRRGTPPSTPNTPEGD